jgi:CheY-like chemotaxis protein/HPt (histidine-containing phosphotransfer) domain-containing protein
MEALELLKSDRYDLLFMDARMPGIDGLKATQLIRNEMNITESEMPVICISAASVSEDWQKYRKAGMNAFLPKPFTEEMLLTTVLSVIKDYATDTITANDNEEKIEPAASEKINLHNLYHISGGDEQFVKQMLVSFIDSTQKGLKEMKEAAFSGRLDSVADLAHKMLPPSRHIGAADLCNLLRKIEESIQKKAEPGSIVTLTNESILEFESITELLKEHITKIG